MIKQFFKKVLAVYLIMFMASNSVFAAEWTKVKECSVANKKLEVWYNPNYTKCEENYVLYTMRFKEKEVGDYINIICTNVDDMSTAVLGTYLYEKKFVPDYSERNSFVNKFQPLDETSMLYPVAKLAIADYKKLTANSGYSYSKTKKTKYKEPKGNFIKSFFGGLATVIGVIIVVPFIILGKILSAG